MGPSGTSGSWILGWSAGRITPTFSPLRDVAVVSEEILDASSLFANVPVGEVVFAICKRFS